MIENEEENEEEEGKEQRGGRREETEVVMMRLSSRGEFLLILCTVCLLTIIFIAYRLLELMEYWREMRGSTQSNNFMIFSLLLASGNQNLIISWKHIAVL